MASSTRHTGEQPHEHEADRLEDVHRLRQEHCRAAHDVDRRGTDHRDRESGDDREDPVRASGSVCGVQQTQSERDRHRADVTRVVHTTTRRREQIRQRHDQLRERHDGQRIPNPLPSSGTRRVRTLEHEIRQIGHEVGRSDPHPPLKSFDIGEPRRTRGAPLEVGAGRGDLDPRRFSVEFGRQRFANRSALSADGTKVPKVPRHRQ